MSNGDGWNKLGQEKEDGGEGTWLPCSVTDGFRKKRVLRESDGGGGRGKNRFQVKNPC